MIISFRTLMFGAAFAILISNGPKLEAMSRSQGLRESKALSLRESKQKAEAEAEAAKEMSEVALARASTCVLVSTKIKGGFVENPFVAGEIIGQGQPESSSNKLVKFTNRIVCTSQETAETDGDGKIIGDSISRVRTEDRKKFNDILQGRTK